MEVVAVTDVHSNVRALEAMGDALAGADLVLLTGDLTNFGDRADAARVVEAARSHNPWVLAVAGNCDHRDVAAYLVEEGISLDGRSRIIEGVAFLGAGGSLPCPADTPNELSEEELAAVLEGAARDLPPELPWALVCHQPPVDTVNDRVHSGEHVGSRTVREFIERRRPLVCFTGHIHEGQGIDTVGVTKVVNPGPARGGRWTFARIGDGLELIEIRERS